MSRTNRVVVLGRGPVRATAAATLLPGPGVTLIGDAGPSAGGGAWTTMMRELRRLDVDLTRFRPANDPDEVPLARYVTMNPVAGADVLLTDESLPPEVVRSALYHARGKVILEPGPSPTWLGTFAPFVHILAPSPATLRALAQAPDDADPLPLAQDLAQQYRVTVVVPINAHTTLVVRRDQEPQRIQVEAGAAANNTEDYFRGALAARVAAKTPILDAVRTATEAAAAWAGTATSAASS
ncbi:hypothetical protein [Kineosporia babensis]|uniref:Uncharacterized protein n=1 Tax=Kineosporia babensis TaxID=499548 RepID=A0A9X1T2S4_9ACTN|nr:hypothetical protein [Kineosporia babensis]MCD5314968.1 hypothetical protein [Kineosporia babensis]